MSTTTIWLCGLLYLTPLLPALVLYIREQKLHNNYTLHLEESVMGVGTQRAFRNWQRANRRMWSVFVLGLVCSIILFLYAETA